MLSTQLSRCLSLTGQRDNLATYKHQASKNAGRAVGHSGRVRQRQACNAALFQLQFLCRANAQTQLTAVAQAPSRRPPLQTSAQMAASLRFALSTPRRWVGHVGCVGGREPVGEKLWLNGGGKPNASATLGTLDVPKWPCKLRCPLANFSPADSSQKGPVDAACTDVLLPCLGLNQPMFLGIRSKFGMGGNCRIPYPIAFFFFRIALDIGGKFPHCPMVKESRRVKLQPSAGPLRAAPRGRLRAQGGLG